MKNPWENLPNQAPYILKEDEKIINAFNLKEENINGKRYFFHLEEVPVPFVGNVLTAPVVLLLANPGYKDDDNIRYNNTGYTNDPYYLDCLWKMIKHENTDYPYFCLDPQIKVGQQYWFEKFKELRSLFDDKILANSICNIQYVAYTSKEFKTNKELEGNLPSQSYNFYLVRKAIEREAIIIATRLEKLWKEAVPELIGYSKLMTLGNNRNITISKGNIKGENSFEKIVEAIRNHNK